MSTTKNTTTTKRTTTKPDTSTLEGVFTALASGAITPHDAAVLADTLSSANVKRTVADTARASWIIGMSADMQYVTDHGKPANDGQSAAVSKVAEHAASFGSTFEDATLRNAISLARGLASLNVVTMASFDATFSTFADRCADKTGKAFKSDERMYKLQALQFGIYIGRLAKNDGRIDPETGVAYHYDSKAKRVTRRTIEAVRKSDAKDETTEREERLATITADGYKIGRVSVSSVVMLSKKEREDLRLLLDSLSK